MPATAYKRGGLLAQIEADVVDDTVPVSSLLQKCIVLGGQAGSEKMRDWARRELNGYAGTHTVPDYRHVPAALMALITNRAGYNGITQRFDDSVFPRQIRDIIRDKVDLEDAILGEGSACWRQWPARIRRASPHPELGRLYRGHAERAQHGTEQPRRGGLLVDLQRVDPRHSGPCSHRPGRAGCRAGHLTPQDQEVPGKAAADQAVQFVITGDRPTIHYGNSHAGDIVTHDSGSEYNFGGVTGNVAAGSSDVTQNYNAGFDITKVREFADLAAEVACLLGLDAARQSGLSDATSELHEAISDPAADKGRMRRAVDAVMGYLKLATGTALRNAAITAGNRAGSDSISRSATCIYSPTRRRSGRGRGGVRTQARARGPPTGGCARSGRSEPGSPDLVGPGPGPLTLTVSSQPRS